MWQFLQSKDESEAIASERRGNLGNTKEDIIMLCRERCGQAQPFKGNLRSDDVLRYSSPRVPHQTIQDKS